MHNRPALPEVLMDIALIWAKRSTCRRLQVGCVVAKDSRVISTGYNGVPSGMPHCNCFLEGDPCVDSVHAEANAIVFAARQGISTQGSYLYTTHLPCLKCAQLIINSGIERVLFRYEYRNLGGHSLLTEGGVFVDQI